MKKFLAFILTVSFISCGSQIAGDKEQNQDDQSKKINWKTLDKPEFSIQYPENWELSEDEELLAEFYVSSPEESRQDRYRENVSLVAQDLNGQVMDLDAYAKSAEEQVVIRMKNARVLESEIIKREEDEYHKFVYTSDQSVFNLTFEEFCRIVNGKIYVLRFTSETKNFEKYKETGEVILKSFKLKASIPE